MKKHLQYIACSLFLKYIFVHIFKIQNSELDNQNKGIKN